VKRLSYVDTPAQSLIGERMLIIEMHQSEDGLRVHARVKRDSRICFRAGVVVKQQLEAQRFFPVWARLFIVQGQAHEYYKLDLACTTEVCGGLPPEQRWRVNYDPTTKTWLHSACAT